LVRVRVWVRVRVRDRDALDALCLAHGEI